MRPEIVVGSGLSFVERGLHELKGVSERKAGLRGRVMRRLSVVALTLVLAACVATPAPPPTPSEAAAPPPPVATPTIPPTSTAAPAADYYVGATYRITLPPPWRRSTCMTYFLQAAVPGDRKSVV